MMSRIPVIKWKRPPLFKVNPAWRVVSGEKSQELETEMSRQARMSETIHLRTSVVPLNPSEPIDVGDTNYNEENIPIVPSSPTNEAEAQDVAMSETSASTNLMIPQPHNSISLAFPSPSSSLSMNNPHTSTVSSLSGLNPGILSILQSALALASNTDREGIVINQELLMKILSNPNLIEQLRNQSASSSTGTHNMMTPSSSSFHNTHVSGVSKTVAPHRNPLSSSSSSAQYEVASCAGTRFLAPSLRIDPPRSSEPLHNSRPANLQFNPPVRMGSAAILPSVRSSLPVTKDINYFKSLIQQHGEERKEMARQHHSSSQGQASFGTTGNVMKLRDSNQPMKRRKPCMYFNTPRGCKKGDECEYPHDMLAALQQRFGGRGSEVSSAKRMRMDREHTGR